MRTAGGNKETRAAAARARSSSSGRPHLLQSHRSSSGGSTEGRHSVRLTIRRGRVPIVLRRGEGERLDLLCLRLHYSSRLRAAEEEPPAQIAPGTGEVPPWSRLEWLVDSPGVAAASACDCSVPPWWPRPRTRALTTSDSRRPRRCWPNAPIARCNLVCRSPQKGVPLPRGPAGGDLAGLGCPLAAQATTTSRTEGLTRQTSYGGWTGGARGQGGEPATQDMTPQTRGG
jgi:hypothetical protein